VYRLYLEQKREIPGKRVHIHQQNLLAANPLPLKRQIACDSSGPAGALCGHDGNSFGRLFAGSILGWLNTRELSERRIDLFGGQRKDLEIRSPGAQASPNEVR